MTLMELENERLVELPSRFETEPVFQIGAITVQIIVIAPFALAFSLDGSAQAVNLVCNQVNICQLSA